MIRGCVYWAHWDKRRPVLVVSPDGRNTAADDVIVVPCSRGARPLRTHVHLATGEGGLDQATWLKCEQITTLRKDAMDPVPAGRPVRPETMRAIELAILVAIGVEPR